MGKDEKNKKGKSLLWQAAKRVRIPAKRVLAVVLAILMVSAGMDFSGLSTVRAADETEQTSGTCGDGLTWTLDGSTLTIIGNGAMANYDDDSSVPWYSSKASIKTVVINEGVTSIGKKAFYWCKSLESIEIPSSVTTIGEYAFYACSGLKSISILGNVTTIGKSAFSGCSGLESIEIPSSVTTIGESAFWGCRGLESIEIPSSVTTIGERVFYECSGLKSISILGNVTTIGDCAFFGCRGLESIEIPSSVTTIGESAFRCSGLKSISILGNVTTIGKSAFYGCSGLESIEIPSSVTTIGKEAFYGCRSLTSIEIPSSVTTIGEAAFSDCVGLTEIKVDGNNKTFSSEDGRNAIIEKSSNTLIAGCNNTIIPTSVTTIGTGAFRGCSGLESIEIPPSVTTIGEFAFCGCSGLESISILGNVTTIGDFAFSACSSLESISIPTSVTTIGDYAFNECTNLTIVNYSTCEVTGGKCIRNYINYDLNEGSWNDSASALKDGTSEKCFYEQGKGNSDLASATDVIAPSDKEFAGWYRNKEFTGEKVTSISDTETKSITLYAKWLLLPNIKFVDEKSEKNLNSTYTGDAVTHSTTKNELFTWGGDGTAAFTYYLSDGNTKTGTEGDQVSGATSEGSAPVNAGEYIVKVTVEENGEYCEETSEGFSFTIASANISGADVSLSPSSFYYTGNAIECQPSVTCNEKTLTLNKDYTISYQNNVTVHDADGADAPTYTITGTGNYTGTKTGTFEIKYYDGKVTPTFNDASYAADKWYPSNVEIKADGYLISDSLTGNYVEKYTVNKSGTNTVTLYFKTNEDGYITSGTTYTIKIDTTAPSFEGSDNGIKITSHSSWWQKLLTAVSFGAYKSQTVTIKAADTESGVATYYYYLDSNPGTAPLTADGLNALDESVWTEASSGTFQMNSDGKYIVYAYAVDKMENKSAYICSDGIVIDNTAPTATITVPDDTKKDVTATIHITSTEAGNVEYLVTSTENASIDYATLKNNSNEVTCSITDAQAGTEEGKGVDCALTNLTPNTTYYVYAFATDAAGNTSALASTSFKTAKTTPAFDTAPTLTGTYGDTVSALKINGESVSESGVAATSSNGVVGHWAITETNAAMIIPTVGTATAYEVTFTPTDAEQYSTYKTTVVPTISKKKVTVTITDKQKTYGEANPTFEFTVPENAFVGEDTKADLAVSLQCAATQTANIGEYDITGTSTSANYDVTFTKGTLTVNQAAGALTVPKDTISKTYGDAAFSLGCSTNGDGTISYASGNTDVATVDANGTVTIKKAGTATITVSLAAGTNYTGAADQTVTINVAKKAAITLDTINRTYVYTAGSKDSAVSIDLAALLPADRGTTSYSLAENSASYITDKAVDANGNLTYKVGTNGTSEDTTNLVVTAQSDNYENTIITVMITLADKLQPELKSGSTISLNGGSAYIYGEKLSSKTFDSAVFVENGTSNTVAGTLAFVSPDEVPTVGTTTAEWIFTPEDVETYATVSGNIPITVSKATPTVDTPTVTGFTYDPGKKLNTVSIISGTNSVEGSWSWKTPDTVPAVNNNGYTAVFTPNDADNYNTVEKTVTVVVTKATPVVDVLPTALAITYGQTLSDSVLSNGTAKYSDSNDAAVTGSYAWKAGTTKPAVADSNTTEYDVTFTPSDTVNYNGFTVKVKLTVNKAASAPNMPGTTMAPSHSTATVGDVTLPTDWIWNTEDAAKTLSDGVAVTATAFYNGTDKGNYEKESVEITLTRANCDHTKTEIRNAKAATCTEEGYTGDTYCKDCGTLISSGTAIPALGHTGGTATCKEQAVCTRCGEHYGELDPSNHTYTEIRNAKAATCISEGYTGDKYCSDCGAKLSSGTTIAALGHDYVAKITKQPTTTEEGVRTYTCSRCGDTYTESIPKLPENHKHSYTETITKQPSCTEAGVKTFTCSCGDSYTESIAALGHDYVGKITKQPTTTEEGVMTYTCSRCGASYTKPIAKLTSNTSEPQIEGEDGKKGWDVITDTLENAKEGDTVTIDMNGTTTVPGNVIDNIKGKDITVVVDLGNGISWKINGKDVTADQVGDIDFGVTTGTNAIPVDVVNEVTGEKTSIQISLSYDGEFGFTATLSVNMEKKNAGYYANLFYYNESTGKLEFMNAGKIDKDGMTELTFTHASDYTIVVSDEVMDGSNTDDTIEDQNNETSKDKDTTEVDTGDHTDMWKYIWIILLCGIILIIGSGVFFVKKQKHGEQND